VLRHPTKGTPVATATPAPVRRHRPHASAHTSSASTTTVAASGASGASGGAFTSTATGERTRLIALAPLAVPATAGAFSQRAGSN